MISMISPSASTRKNSELLMGKELIDYPNNLHHSQQRCQPSDTRRGRPEHRTTSSSGASHVGGLQWTIPITDGSPWQTVPDQNYKHKESDLGKPAKETQIAFNARSACLGHSTDVSRDNHSSWSCQWMCVIITGPTNEPVMAKTSEQTAKSVRTKLPCNNITLPGRHPRCRSDTC